MPNIGNGAPFREQVLPAAMEKVRRRLRSAHDCDRQMVSILACVLTDDGEARAAVRALIVQVAYLEREIQYFRVAVSSGFSRQWHHKRWEVEIDAGSEDE